MRELKFRVWDKSEDVMFENYRYETENDEHYVVYYPYNKDCYFAFSIIVHSDDDEEIELIEGDFVWMQYTGLKDKNGKEVYEDDFLLDGKSICKVAWVEDEMRFSIQHWVGDNDWSDESDIYYWVKHDKEKGYQPYIDGEVIGNPYENPELLRENKEDE